MKKTVQTFLALILAFAMLTAAFAVISVNAAESKSALTENFETGTKVNVGTDGNYNTGTFLRGGNAGSATVGIVNDPIAGEQNKVFCVHISNNERYNLRFDYTSVKYTASFDFLTTAENIGFTYYMSDGINNGWNYLANFRECFLANNAIASGTNTKDITEVNVWYALKIQRDGGNLTVSVCKKGEATPIYSKSHNYADMTTKAKTVNIFITRAGASDAGDIYFDNFYVYDDVVEDGENVILPGEWVAHSENFSGYEADGTAYHWCNASAPIYSSEGVTFTVVDDGGEKYAKFTPATTKQLQFKKINSKYYSYSFDFMFDANNSNGYGLYLVSSAGTMRYARILNDRADFFCTGAGCNTSRESTQLNTAGQWITCIYEANGDTHTFQLINRSTGEVLLNKTITWICAHGDVDRIPALQFYTSGNDDTVYLDNIRYENTTGKLDVVGVQASTVANDQYALRFIGTVNSLDYTKLGFEVVASYTENGVAKTKTFQLDTCQVYTSIRASASGNAPYVVSAEQLGGEYLIALSITDIPAALGTVTFTVKSFGYYGADNIEVRSEVATFTATPDGTAVNFAKPAAA